MIRLEQGEQANKPTEPRHWPTTMAMAAVIALNTLGLVVFGLAKTHYPLLDGWRVIYGVLPGLMALPFLLSLLKLILRGRSTSLRNLVIAAGLSLLGLPLLGGGILLCVNGLLDHSVPVAHHATVIGAHAAGGGRTSKTYYIDVRSWRPGETSHSFQVDKELFVAARAGMPITVITAAGRFGWEWLIRIERSQNKSS